MINLGISSSIFNWQYVNSNITIKNGKQIPIKGLGTTYLSKTYPPFLLKNVLYASSIIKNLISVRPFTLDNSVSVEFDPFGLSVKDL